MKENVNKKKYFNSTINKTELMKNERMGKFPEQSLLLKDSRKGTYFRLIKNDLYI